MRLAVAALLLAGCVRLSPDDSEVQPFEETLAPDSLHLLTTRLPSAPGQDALVELDLSFEQRWSFGLLDAGAQGAWRLEGGDTVFAAASLPPEFSSSIVRIDAEGALVWDRSDLFAAGMGFSHGVVRTPEGDWIALDTTAGQLVSFDEAGEVLWVHPFHDAGEPGSPNGITIFDSDTAGTLLGVSLLGRIGDTGSQQLALLEHLGPTEPPVERWRWAVQESEGMVFPHGPRFTDGGELLVCLSSLGQVTALDIDGDELWRVPADHRAGALSFPRDALLLPDGTLVVADSASELLRVHDPHGAFEIVSAVQAPDIFSVHPVVCGDGGGLPCLGG